MQSVNWIHRFYDFFPGVLVFLLVFIPLFPKLSFIQVAGSATAIRPEDFLIGLIYLLWIVGLIFHLLPAPKTSLNRIFLILLCLSILSFGLGLFVLKTVPSFGIGALNLLRQIQYVLLFFLAWSLSQKRHLNYYFAAILGTGLIVIIYGLLERFNLVPGFTTFSGIYTLTNFTQMRFAISTFAAHYDLGSYLMLLFPFYFLLLIWPGLGKKRLVFLFILLCWAILFRFVFARAALMGTLFALGVFLTVRRSKWIFLILAILALVGVLYVSGHFSLYDYHFAIQHGQLSLDPSFMRRLQNWSGFIAIFKKDPLFGGGLSAVLVTADNNYLRFLTELGVVGIFAIGFLFVKIGRFLYRTFKDSSDTRLQYFGLSLFLGFMGLLVNAIFIDVFAASKVAFYWWLLLGLYFGLQEKTQQAKEHI